MVILYIIDDLTFGEGSIKLARAIEERSSVDYYIWYRLKNFNYEKAASFRDSIKNSTLLLSNNFEVASKLGYDGVHLNRDSYKLNVGNNLIVGYSAHSVEEVNSIDANYFTLSPIFESKNGEKLLNLDGIIFNKKRVFALGGVNFSNFIKLKEHSFIGPAGIRISLNPI